MATVADLRTYLAAARTAIAAGSHETANTQLMLAESVLVELPDFELDGQRTQWRNTIEHLFTRLDQARAEAGTRTVTGIQRSKITYTDPTD